MVISAIQLRIMTGVGPLFQYVYAKGEFALKGCTMWFSIRCLGLYTLSAPIST
jgi:hypothetical protein